jgi:serine/threonine-protein kinase
MSSSVRDIDPTVERIILKCLDPDPAKRPSGALAVSAALPGGDPLAAALAAGETPSPEMVAAAGAQEGLKPAIAIACLAAILISLAAIVYFDCRQELAAMVNFELPPEALAVQARKTIQQFGYTAPPTDRAFTFDYSGAYLYYLKQQSKQPLDWPKVALSQPPVIYFSYRESPLPLEPRNFDILGRISVDDPPPAISGMARITLDLTGQMRSFSAVPPQVDSSPPLAQQPDPTPLFTAAGLDLKSFQPTDPHWTPLAPVDARAAWTGTFPNLPAQPIRVEAAWWRGKPVYFQIVGPWTQQDRMPSAPRGNANYTWLALEGSGSILAALMAWRNLRLGRGDKQGAIRLAGFVFSIVLVEILLRAHFAAAASSFRLMIEAVSQALWTGALLWLAYIALEPAVRRLWPRSLITWTRLLSGRWQDALVGRDVLIGLLVGMGYDLVFAADNEYTIRMGGIPSTGPKLDALLGIHRALSVVLDRAQDGILGSFLFFLLFFVLRAILRKEWLAGGAFVLLFIGLRLFSSNNNYPLVDVPAMIIVYSVVVVMLLRCGLLALVVAIFVTDLVAEMVFTTNFSAWYGTGSLLLILLVSGLAIFAFRKSLGGHRISAALLDQ